MLECARMVGGGQNRRPLGPGFALSLGIFRFLCLPRIRYRALSSSLLLPRGLHLRTGRHFASTTPRSHDRRTATNFSGGKGKKADGLVSKTCTTCKKNVSSQYSNGKLAAPESTYYSVDDPKEQVQYVEHSRTTTELVSVTLGHRKRHRRQSLAGSCFTRANLPLCPASREMGVCRESFIYYENEINDASLPAIDPFRFAIVL